MSGRYHRPIPPLLQKHIDRFHSRVRRGEPDECWPWLRGRFADGYGGFKVGKQTMKANRVAYFIANGIDPGQLQVCHTCDNPSCCNPAHLFLGDTSANITDAVEKGRIAFPTGSRHYTRRRPDLMELRRGDGHWTHKMPERTSKGENNGAAKLTEQDVRSIRALHGAGGVSCESIARKYGCGGETIRLIVQRRTWKHIR
jgi:hypothetical protein